MPTWDEILKEHEQQHPFTVLCRYISAVNEQTKRTTICYMSAFSVVKPPVPAIFHSIIDNDMQGFMTCMHGTDKSKLDLVLHTPGGDFEATKRIINYLHSTYQHIRVFVPHMALSGGTLLACVADEIYMGPYSSLGPTDAQIFIEDRYVPVNAVLKEFDKAFDEVKHEPAKALLWSERICRIPFGIIKAAENVQKNSETYLADLLGKRNCIGKPRAGIDLAAKFLSDVELHSSHSAGISLDVARQQGLNIKDLTEDKELEDAVLSVYHAATIVFQKTDTQKLIVNHKGKSYVNRFAG